MSNPLDSLFQAAAALPTPATGKNQVQVFIGVFAGPISIPFEPPPPSTKGGLMFYTPAKEIEIGHRVPAFFSGSNLPDHPDLKITLTAPVPLGRPSEYILAIESNCPSITGKYNPTAMLTTNGVYVVAASSTVPFVMIVSAPISIDF